MPTPDQFAEYAAENEALAAFRRAQADLYAHTAREARSGITGETPEYHRLNDAVIAVGKKLPKRFRHLAKDV
ncbi:hypothetical protein [Streptomyces sp. NPDC020983]|uniref:hypothetical protein n=1 Tax=Streptomyces sp. NPDC020983 TaxID=3365106 RepID=UPI003788ABAF